MVDGVSPREDSASAGEARAATTAYDLLDQFNAIVFGDFPNSADVEGRTIVGGNLTGGASFYIKPSARDGATSLAALDVYGNAATAKTYNFNNAGEPSSRAATAPAST